MMPEANEIGPTVEALFRTAHVQAMHDVRNDRPIAAVVLGPKQNYELLRTASAELLHEITYRGTACGLRFWVDPKIDGIELEIVDRGQIWIGLGKKIAAEAGLSARIIR